MPPVPVHDLIAFLDELLEPSRYDDFGPNGLQVPGPEEVTRVVTGVSAVVELLGRAGALDADLVLVHHGLFWRGMPQQITPSLHRRLTPLYRHGMALAAYHLPLDGHPEHGNNALLAEALGAIERSPFALHHGTPIGVAATLPDDGLLAHELVAALAAITGRAPLHLPGGPERVRRIGIVSGAGSDYAADAADAGLDALVTGEPAERATAVAREEGIHVVAAGHHATEVLGVRRLGDLLAARFGVEHRFIDVANPV
jgi:dinuclear metal center YbgI/SA1388 family protein